MNFSNAFAVRLALITALLANLFTFFQPFGCPLWLFGAGLLAALWYGRRGPGFPTAHAGMRMGWITGLFSFIIFSVLSTTSFIVIMRSGLFERLMREQLESLPFKRGNADAALQMLSTPAGVALYLVVSLVVMFVIFTAFAVLGGAAGAKLAARKRAAAR